MFSHDRGLLPAARRTLPLLTLGVLAASTLAPQSKAQTSGIQFPGGLPAVSGPQVPPQSSAQANAPAGGSLGGPTADPIVHRIQASSERMEMTANSSRIITLDQNIP